MNASIWLYNLASYSLQIAILVGAGALLARVFRLRISNATLAYWQILLVACLLLPVCQPWKKPVSAASMTVTQPVSESRPVVAAQFDSTGAIPAARTTWPIHEALLFLVSFGRCPARGMARLRFVESSKNPKQNLAAVSRTTGFR